MLFLGGAVDRRPRHLIEQIFLQTEWFAAGSSQLIATSAINK